MLSVPSDHYYMSFVHSTLVCIKGIDYHPLGDDENTNFKVRISACKLTMSFVRTLQSSSVNCIVCVKNQNLGTEIDDN